MWEAIARNRRRSWLLVGLMGVLLVALGAAVGAALVPPAVKYYTETDHGGLSIDPLTATTWGAGAALVLWLVLWAVAAGGGDRVLLSAAGARRIEKHHAPRLWNVVEEMTIASGLGQMPRVYVLDDDEPNAFAVGYRPGRAAVAVTSGLLRRLDRDELQGVVAHEIGHIRNLDVKFMTMAGVMVGAIVLISDVFLRSVFYGGGHRRRSSSRGGGVAALILLAVAILLAILAPLCAQLLFFACSRRREYLADAMSARYTRYPEGLASALEQIGRRTYKRRKSPKTRKANRVLAPMYIVNPLESAGVADLVATHPPIEKRVAILRRMGNRAGFADYEAAFRRVVGEKSHCIGSRTLADDTSVPVRKPSVDPAKAREEAVARAREVGDLLAGLGGYLFVACPCGLRLKVPPDFKHPQVRCPRCGRTHDVPTAAIVTTTVGEALRQTGQPRRKAAPPPPARYRRKGTGWESFKCTCGHTIQISPAFKAPVLHCGKCRRKYEIVS